MITIDFETKSEADLKKVGAWAYSEHPSTDLICVCWAGEDGEVQEWWPGADHDPLVGGMPKDLYMAVMLGEPVEAHNVAFEYSVWHNVLAPRYGWVTPCLHQWRDTMAVACYYALPPGLDRLCRALGFPPKDPEGGRLISKYSKLHLKTAQSDIPDEDFNKFVEYCRMDVLLEQAISDDLGDLPSHELEVFHLDLETNIRGLLLDAEGIGNAKSIVEARAADLEEEFQAITGLKSSQSKAVRDWFNDQGLPIDNIRKETLEELLEDDSEITVPQGPARDAIQLRLQLNKASNKKLLSMLANAGRDGRARFQTRYHGAVTGRNTGAGFQPLNLVRSYEGIEPDNLVSDISYRDPAWLDAIYGDAMQAVSKAGRHWIISEPGHRILAGDYSSIEAIGLACLMGEEWKVDAFRQGVKIYELMGEKIHKLPPGTVTKATHPAERQDGKTGELAFGYQGALNAWLKFDSSGRHSDERIIEICKAWRAEHPAIVTGWYSLQHAAIEAAWNPGRLTGYRDIGFEVVDEWLTMILPDGKRLWYRDPQVIMGMPHWHKPAEDEECATGECGHEPIPKLRYMSWKSGQWKRVYTYGGKLAENATQAVCRQMLRDARLRIKKAGYPEILTVYDEIVTETPKNHGSLEEFKEILTADPAPWYEAWPIKAECWEGYRYRK